MANPSAFAAARQLLLLRNCVWRLLIVYYATVVYADLDITDVLKAVQTEVRNGSYVARVEFSELVNGNPNRLTFVEEFHDASEGVHALYFADKASTSYFFYGKTKPKTLIQSDHENCTVLNLENNSSTFLYAVGNSRDREFVLGPTGILATLRATNFKQVSYKRIRGINCYCWVSSLPGNGATIRLYFAADAWRRHVRWPSTSRHEPSLLFPLRIETQEHEQTIGEVLRRIDIFQLYWPRSSLERQVQITARLLPPFVDRPCRVPAPLGRSPPSLSRRVHFVTVTSSDTRTKEWYDEDLSAYRCRRDQPASDPQNPREVDDKVIDGLLGVEFKIEDEFCSISPAISSLESYRVGSLCPGSVVIDALRIPDKAYIGVSSQRGRIVDVWQVNGRGPQRILRSARLHVARDGVAASTASSLNSHKTDFHEVVLVEARLVDPDGVKNDDDDDDDGDNLPPLDGGVIHVFNFDATSISESTLGDSTHDTTFDVLDCLPRNVYAEIVLRSRAPFRVEYLMRSTALAELTALMKSAVLKATKISPLRLPYIKLAAANDRQVVATLRLLEAPSYLDAFRQRPEEFPTRFVGKVPGEPALDAEDCARACIELAETEHHPCVTILFCDDPARENPCYRMPSDRAADWGQPEGESRCIAFDKSTSVHASAYKRLDNVSNLLGELVEQSGPEFRFDVHAFNDTVSFYATEFRPFLMQFNDHQRDGPYSEELTGYSIRPNHSASLAVTSDGVTSMADCYHECVKSKDLACTTFSYCPAHDGYDNNNADVTGGQHSAEHDIINNNIIINNSDKKKNNNDNNNQVENADKPTMTSRPMAGAVAPRCVLSSLNINGGMHRDSEQMNAIQPHSGCDILSVRYLDLFERVPGEVAVTLPSARSSGSIAADCALTCRQESLADLVGECRSFDFCADQQSCFLYDGRTTANHKLAASSTRRAVADFISSSTPVAAAAAAAAAAAPLRSATHRTLKNNNDDDDDNNGSEAFEVVEDDDDVKTKPTSRPGCVRYTLQFAADYRPIGKWTIAVDGTTEVAAVSVEECATLCSEFSEGRCRTMAHCDVDERSGASTNLGRPDSASICFLYPVLLKDAPTRSPSAHCTLFARNADVKEIIQPSRQETHAKSVSGLAGLSNGAFVSLLLLMLALGIALGITGFSRRGSIRRAIKTRTTISKRDALTDPLTADYSFQNNGNNEAAYNGNNSNLLSDTSFTRIDF